MSLLRCEPTSLKLDETSMLHSIVNNAEDSIFIKDASCKYVLVNPAMERLFGMAAAELLDKADDEIFGEEAGRHIAESDARVLRGEVVREEHSRPVNGDIRTFHVIKSPLKDEQGRVVGLCGIARDITERKKMEEALNQAQDKLVATNVALRDIESIYKTFAEAAMDQIGVFDVDCNVVYINKSGAYGFRSTVDAVRGKNLKELIPPRPYVMMKATLQKAIDTKEPYVTEAAISMHGKKVWQQAHILPIMDDSDSVRMVMAITRDVTDYKVTEKALRDSKLQADLYVDLMSHDINNINQIAEGYVELVMDGMDPESGQYELLSRSLGALKNSSKLIENVRKIQRSMSGDSKRTRIDAGAILQEAAAEYVRLPGSMVFVDRAYPGEYFLSADEFVYDVFSNLIDNAVKHSGKSARVDIGIGRAVIDGKPYVSVWIEDNGPGIPDERKLNVFTRFFSGSSRQKSRGLGLYLVKSLVDGYSGFIKVEDRVPGDHTKGSKFIVNIPSAE